MVNLLNSNETMYMMKKGKKKLKQRKKELSAKEITDQEIRRVEARIAFQKP